MSIPQLTTEPLQAARAAATQARRVRAELKAKVRTGALSLSEALDVAAADEVLNRGDLVGGILVQSHCENGDAAFGGYVFYPAVDLPREGVIDGTDEEAEGFGLAVDPSQAAGAHINLVIESVDCIPDSFGSLGRNSGFIIDNTRYRFGAHTGQRSHLFHSRVFLHGGRVNSIGGRRDH